MVKFKHHKNQFMEIESELQGDKNEQADKDTYCG